jgi:predicted DNA-binding transcriptional regulator AlpA
MTDTQTKAEPSVAYLTLSDIAAVIGVGVDSIRVYHQRATRNRRSGSPKPGDLPKPDETFGRSPVWSSETINAWVESRPGRGAGGGRPRPRA